MEQLELANTIGQMKDKINEIINSIEENVTEIKLYNASNETQYVTITYDGTKITFTDQGNTVVGEFPHTHS